MMKMSEKYGISYFVFRTRISRGWPVKDALFKPFGTALFEPKTAKGSQLPQARLTELDVIEIKRIYRTKKLSMEEIGIQFRVSAATICMIMNGKTWKHVA